MAFVIWLDTHSIRKKFGTEVWYRITNDPRDWPINLGTISDKELWKKFKEDQKKEKNERKT